MKESTYECGQFKVILVTLQKIGFFNLTFLILPYKQLGYKLLVQAYLIVS